MHAHKHRSFRMISQFNQQKSTPIVASAALTSDSGSTTALIKEMLVELTNARKFAQFLVVGLIEACKGVYDLFQVNYLEGTTEEQHLKEARQAHGELQQMLHSVMAEYTKSMSGAFTSFFERFNAHFLNQQVEYLLGEGGATYGAQRDSSATAESNEPASSSAEGEERASDAAPASTALSDEKLAAEFKLSELQDERNKWLSLARQSINDVIYLDSTQNECFNNCQYEAGDNSRGLNVSYAQTFSDALILSISTHGDTIQAHRVSCYLSSVAEALPSIQSLCQIKSGSSAAATSTSSASAGQEVTRPRLGGRTTSASSLLSDPVAERATLTKNTAAARKLTDSLVNNAIASFREAARDFKSAAEIFEVANREVEEAVVVLVAKHVERLAFGVENLCGVANHKYSFDSVTVTSTSLRSSQGGNSSDELANDDIDLIYSEDRAAVPASGMFICLALLS